ncbi:MAG: sigma-E processing peptidase SpoIIGA [Lysinibacillus sp.]
MIVCSRLLDERVKIWRACTASFMSSCCTVFIPTPIIATIAAFLVLQLAFTRQRRMLKMFYVLLSTALLGGMFSALQTYATTTMSYVTGSIVVVMLFALVMLQIVERLYVQQLLKRYVVKCELRIADERLQCVGFIDTGNQSVEPLSGRAIHFAHIELLAPLTEIKNAYKQWDASMPNDVSMFPKHLHKQLQPLYVTTVEQQILVLAIRCAVRLEDVTLESQYVVFVEQPFQFRQQVQVVLNASVIKNIKGDRYCYEA